MISFKIINTFYKKKLFLDDRRGQGIKYITWNISKPKMTLKAFYIPLLFKPIECMDTIRVVHFLYYESMMRVLCPKPSFFCVNEPSLYARNVVGILIKLIFFRDGIFLNNHNNVVFAWIFCMRNMTCLKMGNDVLTFLYLVRIYISYIRFHTEWPVFGCPDFLDHH